MIKKLLLYAVISILIFCVSYFPHNYFLDTSGISHIIDLKGIYLFHAIGSLILCITFEIIYVLVKSLREQIGFMYLGSTLLKVMLFFIVFSNILLYSSSIPKSGKVSLLLPLGIFIIFEVIVVVKILNRPS